MSHEFHGDETLITSHETLVFSFLAVSTKMIVFNIMNKAPSTFDGVVQSIAEMGHGEFIINREKGY